MNGHRDLGERQAALRATIAIARLPEHAAPIRPGRGRKTESPTTRSLQGRDGTAEVADGLWHYRPEKR